MTPGRVIAVDWSGDRRCEDRIGAGTLWIAEVADGRLVHLAPTSRVGAVERVLDAADDDPELVVGLDVAFSYPAWFVRSLGAATVQDLWSVADPAMATAPPFWGWKGSRRPAPDRHRPLLRRTDAALPPAKSPFQVAGPGAVGTGALTAFVHLHRLAAAGVSIWPFDGAVPGCPLTVEIYPRRFTVPPVVKSDPSARAGWWAAHGPPGPAAALVEASDDAFDAAVSALALWNRRRSARSLPAATDPEVRLEGWVFDLPLDVSREATGRRPSGAGQP